MQYQITVSNKLPHQFSGASAQSLGNLCHVLSQPLASSCANPSIISSFLLSLLCLDDDDSLFFFGKLICDPPSLAIWFRYPNISHTVRSRGISMGTFLSLAPSSWFETSLLAATAGEFHYPTANMHEPRSINELLSLVSMGIVNRIIGPRTAWARFLPQPRRTSGALASRTNKNTARAASFRLHRATNKKRIQRWSKEGAGMWCEKLTFSPRQS
jgi:hypothetical protein